MDAGGLWAGMVQLDGQYCLVACHEQEQGAAQALSSYNHALSVAPAAHAALLVCVPSAQPAPGCQPGHFSSPPQQQTHPIPGTQQVGQCTAAAAAAAPLCPSGAATPSLPQAPCTLLRSHDGRRDVGPPQATAAATDVCKQPSLSLPLAPCDLLSPPAWADAKKAGSLQAARGTGLCRQPSLLLSEAAAPDFVPTPVGSQQASIAMLLSLLDGY